MQSNAIHTERRQKRSEERQLATTYQLDHVREKFGFLAVVLADKDGFWVASSTEQGDGEAIAAYASAISDADASSRDELTHELKAQQFPGRPDVAVRVHEFGLADYPSHLVIVAPQSEFFESAMSHAIRGVRRIFATT